MTTLLQKMLKGTASGYSLLQQTHTHAGNNRGRGSAAASSSARRAVGALLPPSSAVVAFSLICVLLAQRRNQVASILKDLNEAVEKMNELTEVVHSLRDELEKGK